MLIIRLIMLITCETCPQCLRQNMWTCCCGAASVKIIQLFDDLHCDKIYHMMERQVYLWEEGDSRCGVEAFSISEKSWTCPDISHQHVAVPVVPVNLWRANSKTTSIQELFFEYMQFVVVKWGDEMRWKSDIFWWVFEPTTNEHGEKMKGALVYLRNERRWNRWELG